MHTKDFLTKSVSIVLKYFTKTQLVILAVLFIAVFFFGESTLVNRFRNAQTIGELKEQIKYYRNETETGRKKTEELTSGRTSIEKFARENYLMKKADEDVFVVK